MSGIVFINYRRKDQPGMAGRLFDRLEQDFSYDQLFFDVDDIPPGADFVAYLNEKIAACDVLLTIIGPSWQSQLDKHEYKQGDKQSKDFVRIEIEAALEQGKTVIPVLVSGAEMPHEEDLPETLQPLARRNAVRLSHERFKADAAGIAKALKGALAEAEEMRATAAQEAARLRAEEERKAKREAKGRAEKDAARHQAAAAGLSPEQIAKAEELANWNFIAERDDIGKLRDHLARFPRGTTAGMAAEKLEALLWHGLGEAPTIATLKSFLEEFPEGAHAAKAKQRLDDLEKTKAVEREAKERAEKELTAWNTVRDTTKPQTLDAFLRDWPKSPHKAEALKLKKALKGGIFTRRRVLIGTGLVSLLAMLVVGGVVIGIPPTIQDELEGIPPSPPVSPLRTFKGQEGEVTAIAFSPDGRVALSSVTNRDASPRANALQLWDVASGELLRTLKARGYFTSIAFSPDGYTALLGGNDGNLEVWEVRKGEEGFRTLQGRKLLPSITTVAFSPDGRTALSGDLNGNLKLWDVVGGNELLTFEDAKGSISSVAFSPDGRTALSGNWDGTIGLWDVEKGKKLRTFEAEASFNSVAFSSDGRTVLGVGGAYAGALTLWDAATGEKRQSFTGIAPFGGAFAPDRRTVLANGNPLGLWDVATGELRRSFASDRASSITFSPDGRRGLSGKKDGTIELWDVAVIPFPPPFDPGPP